MRLVAGAGEDPFMQTARSTNSSPVRIKKRRTYWDWAGCATVDQGVDGVGLIDVVWGEDLGGEGA